MHSLYASSLLAIRYHSYRIQLGCYWLRLLCAAWITFVVVVPDAGTDGSLQHPSLSMGLALLTANVAILSVCWLRRGLLENDKRRLLDALDQYYWRTPVGATICSTQGCFVLFILSTIVIWRPVMFPAALRRIDYISLGTMGFWTTIIYLTIAIDVVSAIAIRNWRRQQMGRA